MRNKPYRTIDRISRFAFGKQSQGFSLLELLVASVILAAGLAVILQSITNSGTSSSRTAHVATAHQIAVDCLNRFAADQDQSDLRDFRVIDNVNYECSMEYPATSVNGISEVAAVVRWSERNEMREVRLVRLILPETTP